VNTEEVKQVRHIFLDQAYRREIGRESFYQSQYEALDEIENVFGELQGVAFQNSLKDFWVALQELAKEPESIVTRASLVQTAVSIVERSENIYKQIRDYQLKLNTQIQEKVDRINEIGEEIAELNRKICFYECDGVEHANDLRDRRNSLLDELGQYVNITWREELDHQVTVIAEQMPFVTNHISFPMSTMSQAELLTRKLTKQYGGDAEALARATDEAERLCNGAVMLVPVWPIYGDREVFNYDTLPSTKANTDIGGLKGLVLARGTRVGKFSDIPIRPTEEEYTEDGVLDEDAYAVAMAQYEEKARDFNREINPSVIMTVQAEFDQLIHGIATTVNNILSPNKDYTFEQDTTVTLSDGRKVTYKAGDTVRVFDRENAPVGMDAAKSEGVEMFSRKSVSRYETVVLSDGTELMIYNEEDPLNNYSLYTLGELEINSKVMENKSMIPLSDRNGTGDFDMKTAEKLIEAWQSKFAALSPNTLTINNFTAYYTSFIGEIANRGETLNKIAEKQDAMVASIENKRMSVTGVSSDEELTNLIRFQHAYNAAARYMNVVDEMIEHIVTRL
ncbi:MAG: hypothetical protein K2N94_16050, partial [Lachnospiraceae bacterium]|nr:hypothetical protein [Lachnospiraceae bacterium]